MNSDTQHLDFLISQYVDGCLDGAGKKSVEQKLMTDPAARELYREHREVQDLLGHNNVETTMIYTHVMRDMTKGPQSPLDLLAGSKP